MMKFTEKHRKGLSIISFCVFILFFLAITVFLGKPLLSLLEDPELFRDWVEERGWTARIIFIGMVFLQVVVALIPGEPLEIAAGLAFGAVEGTILSLAGIALGSAAVFFLVRSFGVKFVEVFFPIEKIHSLRFLQNARKLDITLFLLMLIPGTPKDLISYFVGLTPMNAGHWLLLTTVARIPSVVTSTIGGDAIGLGEYGFAAVVFAVSVAISMGGVILYDRLLKYRQKKKEKSKNNLSDYKEEEK